jgi:hypothetical protein
LLAEGSLATSRGEMCVRNEKAEVDEEAGCTLGFRCGAPPGRCGIKLVEFDMVISSWGGERMLPPGGQSIGRGRVVYAIVGSCILPFLVPLTLYPNLL